MYFHDAGAPPDGAGPLSGGGEMGALIRGHDWSATPLGPVEHWPQALKSAIGMVLRAGSPMAVYWGPELTLLYNDAWRRLIGNKHPQALGRPAREVFPEVWGGLEPMFARVLAGEGSVEARDELLPLERDNRVEHAWFNFQFDPIPLDDHSIGGMLNIATENTQRVLAERQLREVEAAVRAERDRGFEILESISDAFYAVDAEWRFTYVNHKTEEWWGRTREKLLGKVYWDEFPQAVGSEPHKAHLEAAEKRQMVRLESVSPIIGKWVDITIYPTRDGGLSVYFRDITEKKQAEARLREREEHMRLILDGAKDYAIITTDPERRVTSWSRGAEAAFGQTASEMIGRSADEIFTPGDRAAGVPEQEAGTAAEQGCAEDKRWHRRADGSRVFMNGSTHPLPRDSHGRERGFLKIARDETRSRQQAEELSQTREDLAKREERHRKTLEIETVAVVYFDMKGVITDGNAAFLKLIGCSREELDAGEVRYERLTPPEWRWRDEQTVQELISTGHSGPFEKEYLRRDGSRMWILCASKLLDEETAVEFIIDVTERRRAEEALRELNETLESQVTARAAERDRLWNLSEDMLALADYQGMMSAVSPAWTQVLGWSETELLSRGYVTLMHPDDVPPTLAVIQRMAETRRPTRFENRIAARDGSWKHIEWTVAPEPDGRNFIAVGRDLSESREREAELAVAQEALRQSQKMEAMGQLTGGVAHDFNNLLTPIVGSLDLLQRKGVGGAREQRLIDGALQSAERAKTLVQRLLAFARRQPLQSGAVDIGRLVEGMADLLSSTTGPQVRVVVDVAEDLPPAKADPNQLEMALLNLGVNARDAMPDGGTLRISATRESVRQPRGELKPGHYVRLSVADTGTGMDETTLARAVEPFFSTKGIGKGTGLGLSMAHGLAAQLGGALTIESRAGVGTNVEFWLPVSQLPLQDDCPRAEPIEVDGNRGLALLVDDEDIVRASTADMLADLGYRVEEATSAEAALALVNNGLRPDLLVTDHLMPGMTGVDLVREVRERCPDLPALIVSGYAEADGIAPDLPRLTKPFRRSELAEKLGELRVDASV